MFCVNYISGVNKLSTKMPTPNAHSSVNKQSSLMKSTSNKIVPQNNENITAYRSG